MLISYLQTENIPKLLISVKAIKKNMPSCLSFVEEQVNSQNTCVYYFGDVTSMIKTSKF